MKYFAIAKAFYDDVSEAFINGDGVPSTIPTLKYFLEFMGLKI